MVSGALLVRDPAFLFGRSNGKPLWRYHFQPDHGCIYTVSKLCTLSKQFKQIVLMIMPNNITIALLPETNDRKTYLLQ